MSDILPEFPDGYAGAATPFVVESSQFDDALSERESRSRMRRRGRQFLHAVVRVSEPDELDWLQRVHALPVVHMLDAGLREFGQKGNSRLRAEEGLGPDTFERMRLTLDTQYVGKEIGALVPGESGILSNSAVLQERHDVEWRIQRLTQYRGVNQWMLEGLREIKDIAADRVAPLDPLKQTRKVPQQQPPLQSDAAGPEHRTARKVEQTRERAVENSRRLLISLANGNQPMADALLTHFMDTEHLPSRAQNSLLRMVLHEMRRHFYEFDRINRYKSTYPKPEPGGGYGLYVALIGNDQLATPPVPRSGLAVRIHMDRDEVIALDDIGLWRALQWQFLIPPPQDTRWHE